MLLSLGELNENKNHQVVIRAIAKLPVELRNKVVYLIAGGGNQSILKTLIDSLSLTETVHLLGYRTDASLLYQIADAYILPSLREGLNVSLMEAMASGLPCIVGNIRGNVDLIDKNGGELFTPSSVEECKEKIKKMLQDNGKNQKKMSDYNRKKILEFSKTVVTNKMKKIYEVESK